MITDDKEPALGVGSNHPAYPAALESARKDRDELQRRARLLALAVIARTDERDAARNIAVNLEQENAELRARCGALINDWLHTGSNTHAHALAAALDLTEGPE